METMADKINKPGSHAEIFITRPYRPWFVIAFVTVWLCGWTFGGIGAIYGFSQSGGPFLIIWLCGWALGMAYAISMLLWFFRGQQTVMADRNSLEIETVKPWSTKRDNFKAEAISYLQIDASFPTQSFFMRANTLQMPWNTPGRIQFDCYGRTHSFGLDIDPAQGREIIARLRSILPDTAFAGST